VWRSHISSREDTSSATDDARVRSPHQRNIKEKYLILSQEINGPIRKREEKEKKKEKGVEKKKNLQRRKQKK